jgi:hypothetical protein
MNGENHLKTLGVILIKYNSSIKGREGNLKNFILSLPEIRRDAGQNGGGCSVCRERKKQEKSCLDLCFVSAGTLVGFFDFNITLRAKDIETIERFIINCLRNGDAKDWISETQTIAGSIFAEWGTKSEDC